MPSDLQAAGPASAIAAPGAAPGAATSGAGPTHFFHPVVDFLCLGGLSFIVLPICLLLPDTAKPEVLFATALLAHAINHPHFAHSYQIFYRNFTSKAFGSDYAPGLRARYVFAGIGAPLVANHIIRL